LAVALDLHAPNLSRVTQRTSPSHALFANARWQHVDVTLRVDGTVR
jgi:hypothetical protein